MYIQIMSDWRERAEISGDVVFFRYAPLGLEKSSEEVFVWDLDKTYLDTSIDSLSGLLQTILEKAMTKKNIPGTDTLLQALAQYRAKIKGQSFFPIYFITASPPQMEERIMEKLEFDKINPLGCFYKDNLKNLRPRRFWRLTKQVGYKLQALLQLRTRLHPDVRQVFWGDDSESDAIIYNLYSDICSRRISPMDLRNVLEKLYVTGDQVDTIMLLQSEIPENDPVEKIYINLATDTDSDYYLKFGRRTLATENTFQVALDLFQDQKIDLAGLHTVIQDMISNYDFTPEELMKSYDEIIRRGVIGKVCFEKTKAFFVEKGLLYASFEPSMPPVQENTIVHEPWVQERIDYLHDYR